MADQDVKRDDNRVTGMLAENESGETKPVVVTDATQRVKVDAVISGGSSSGTQYDVSDVAGATDTGTLALAVRDDSLTTLTPADGDYVQLRTNSTGALHVTGGGGGTEYTEDEVTADPQVGTATLVERDDALTTVTPVEGDWIGLRGSAEGALWTQDFNSDAILADTTSILSDTTAILADTAIISGAVSGSEMQVDIIAALPAGTNAIGKLAANSGIDIGDVDVTSTVGITTEGSALGSGILIQGDDGTDRKNINVDATTGDVQVDVTNTVTVDGSGVTQPVSASSLPLPTGAATSAKQLADGHNVTVDNSTGTSAVNIQDGGNSITVDGTITEANSTAILADTASIDTSASTVAGAVSGSEMQVDVVAPLPAGTAAIGKLAANSGVDIGDVTINNVAASPVISNHSVTGIGDGIKTVTSAGTDVAIATTTAAVLVVVQAQTDNTGLIAVGATGVDATVATGTGIILSAGDSIPIPCDDLANVFVDATVSGDGVRFIYYT